MTFSATTLDGSFIIEPVLFEDGRGWFARTFCKNEFAEIAHTKEWVQINHSFTNKKGSIRGMHYQNPPYSEIKLVRCISGAVYDVIIDLRKSSATYLQWLGIELSAKNKKMIYIPEGFAHGFQTLSDDAELIYHHSEFYAPGVEAGIRYDDPKVNIEWPLEVTMVSERDREHPRLDDNFKGV